MLDNIRFDSFVEASKAQYYCEILYTSYKSIVNGIFKISRLPVFNLNIENYWREIRYKCCAMFMN